MSKFAYQGPYIIFACIYSIKVCLRGQKLTSLAKEFDTELNV